MFNVDTFSLISIAGYLLVAFITLASAPAKDLEGKHKTNLAMIVIGSLISYIAGNLWLFAFGWILSALPLRRGRSGLFLMLTSVPLLIGAVLHSSASDTTSQRIAFGAIVLAALLRKGIFPFHFWIPMAFEEASLPQVNLVLNSHLGAFLMIRFGFQLFPQLAAESLSVLGLLAIFTALYAAILALVAKRPKRILALLCLSQASFILAGLENRNIEGITGALVHWLVVSLATTSLVSVYRALEVRTTEVHSPAGFLGLGFHAPRLGVFFSIGALTLVGLPGTLGFAAEDLLFHGALESHPLLGIGLPLATALNAITSLRLLSTLFLGKRGVHVPAIADALPRERFALTVPVLVLVAGGISPGLFVALRSPSAHWIAEQLTGR